MSAKKNRVAIVSGATSGIGEATTRRLIAMGFGLIGSGRNRDKLRALSEELGDAFVGVEGDAADEAVLEELFAAGSRRFDQPPDAVIVNAGRGLGGTVKDAARTEFEEVLRVNVTGAFALMQKAARHMVVAQEGSYPRTPADIVIIGSVVGRHISPFSAVYGSSKFAVHALAEGLRREVGPQGVRVSLVEPGVVLSGFQAGAGYSEELVEGFDERFGPLLIGEDVANAIHFILSQPPHVHISDLVVRPTRQDYP